LAQPAGILPTGGADVDSAFRQRSKPRAKGGKIDGRHHAVDDALIEGSFERFSRLESAISRAGWCGQAMIDLSCFYFPRKSVFPWASPNLASPILAGTPRNAPRRLTPGFLARAGEFPALALPLRFRLPSVPCGRRRLGSRANDRLWRFVVRARPFARVAPRRRLRSRHRRPCRAATCADSFLRSRPVACTPLSHLRGEPARSNQKKE